MKLVEINLEYQMDVGAPVPKVLASESFLKLFYFVAQSARGVTSNVQMRDAVSDRGIGILLFEDYLNFKFGFPNDEIISGHPYSKYGLNSYSFFEVIDSPWIKELLEIDSIHPMHKPNIFDDYRHFVMTFHDSTFECIAKNYNFKYSKESMAEILTSNVEDLILAK